MAHAFIRLDRLDLAERVAATAVNSLQDRVANDDCAPKNFPSSEPCISS